MKAMLAEKNCRKPYSHVQTDVTTHVSVGLVKHDVFALIFDRCRGTIIAFCQNQLLLGQWQSGLAQTYYKCLHQSVGWGWSRPDPDSVARSECGAFQNSSRAKFSKLSRSFPGMSLIMVFVNTGRGRTMCLCKWWCRKAGGTLWEGPMLLLNSRLAARSCVIKRFVLPEALLRNFPPEGSLSRPPNLRMPQNGYSSI